MDEGEWSSPWKKKNQKYVGLFFNKKWLTWLHAIVCLLFSCWNNKKNNKRNIISGWENETGVYRVGILLIGIPTLLCCVWLRVEQVSSFFSGVWGLCSVLSVLSWDSVKMAKKEVKESKATKWLKLMMMKDDCESVPIDYSRSPVPTRREKNSNFSLDSQTKHTKRSFVFFFFSFPFSFCVWRGIREMVSTFEFQFGLVLLCVSVCVCVWYTL